MRHFKLNELKPSIQCPLADTRVRAARVSKRSLLLILHVLLALILTSLPAYAADKPNQLIDYLSQEKNNLQGLISNLKPYTGTHDLAKFQHDLQQNEAKIALNRAKIVSFENFLSNQKKMQMDFSLRLKQLQQLASGPTEEINAQEKIDRITQLNDLNKKTIALLNEDLSLSRYYQDLLIAENKEIKLWKSKLGLEQRLNNIGTQEERLNESLQKLFDNSLKLQQEVKEGLGFKPTYNLEAKLLFNNQLINLSQHKISELNLQRELAKADYSLLKNPDIRTLEKVTETYKTSINHLSDMEQSLKKMVLMLKYEQPHLDDSKLKQQFQTLMHIINERVSGIGIQEQTLQEDLENHEKELKKQLSIRKNLSEYRLYTWSSILQQFWRIPAQMIHYLKSLFLKLWDNYLWQEPMRATIIWLLIAFSGLCFFLLNKLLKRLMQEKERSRLTGHLYDGMLLLISRNMPQLAILGMVFLVFYCNQVPFANYQLLFHLLLVWLVFRSMIVLARMGLVERLNDAKGQDVSLYYRIRRLLVIGGCITGLMVVSHELPLSVLLQDVFNRLFMLFLVMVSVVCWWSRALIRELLQPLLESKKRYVRNAILLLLILTPITLCLTAILGLIGFNNLAWTMSRYQMQVLVIISAYVLMRGMLFDAMELVSELMIAALQNGWLWIEVILKPLDKIIRVSLLLFSLYVLAQLFESPTAPNIINNILKLGDYTLVNLSGIHITGKSLVEFFIISAIFIWVVKWTREFCFRWLYRHTADAGIRNSLSVFTQYAMILLGGFVALRILGLDFSGMSLLIGGFAVGMGFGLRDFASNIVGGIMLLIERPVREGDLISLGGFEGRVAHIGIRAMRVSSWDNMEVLIPNAETFNKPFTNWTHQDDIVRTVVPIKVTRSEDPELIQRIILDALASIPEIVDEPPVQVLLTQIDEALIAFEVRYFMNVQLYNRFEIRSKLLFAITALFKIYGIKAPIPPINVELQEENREGLLKKYLPDQRD